MTGTLPSIPLSQNVDENGLPQSGCRLFVYEANTSTPVITYKDPLLSAGMEHSWPIVADALGRMPMFFVPDGFYRARLEDRYGTPLYDEAVLPALGTGEGEAAPAPPAVIQFATGDFLWQPVQGLRDGWVRANARTIGNALSGASERANADCASLFAFMWNNYPNEFCPVAGGRGASGPADFSANKVISTLDMRGFGAVGLDGMGNTAASRFLHVPAIGIGSGDAPGSQLGVNYQTMAETQMPNHVHTPCNGTAISADNHYGAQEVAWATLGPSGPGYAFTQSQYVNSIIDSFTMTAKGGSQPQNNLQYSIPGSWYVRL